jgi:hypothetical protein
MGYLKITNLYRRPEYIKLFKTVYCMEKVHGTSAHITFTRDTNQDGSFEDKLIIFSGGADHMAFSTLFNKKELLEIYSGGTLAGKTVTIFGEAYGGKMQGMNATYGKQLRFIAFEVNIDDKWLEVPDAEGMAKRFGQEFIWWTECENTLENLTKYRDQDSQLALLRGCGPGKMAEGIITKPFFECYDKQGGRWILKYKREDFAEVKTPREIDPEAKMNILRGQAVADEFVTEMRLRHILDKNPYSTLQDIPKVIQLMVDDIAAECEGEYIASSVVMKAIGGKTVMFYKKFLENKLLQETWL